jgi:hypothetical protein
MPSSHARTVDPDTIVRNRSKSPFIGLPRDHLRVATNDPRYRAASLTAITRTRTSPRLLRQLILTHEAVKFNDQANPVAASELPCQKPDIGNSSSAFCSSLRSGCDWSQEWLDSLPIFRLLFQVAIAVDCTLAAMIRGKQSNAIQDFTTLLVFDCISQFGDWMPERAEHSMKSERSKANNDLWPHNFNLVAQEVGAAVYDPAGFDFGLKAAVFQAKYRIGQKQSTTVISVGGHADVDANVVEQFLKIAHGWVFKFIQPLVVFVVFDAAPILTNDHQFSIEVTV